MVSCKNCRYGKYTSIDFMDGAKDIFVCTLKKKRIYFALEGFLCPWWYRRDITCDTKHM